MRQPRFLVASTACALVLASSARAEQGGFGPALMNVFQHRDMPRLRPNTICVTGALLFYNLLSVLNRHLGTGGLARVFLSPLQGFHSTLRRYKSGI